MNTKLVALHLATMFAFAYLLLANMSDTLVAVDAGHGAFAQFLQMLGAAAGVVFFLVATMRVAEKPVVR